MIAAEVAGLTVTLGQCTDISGIWPDDGGTGWRVVVARQRLAIPMKFGRKQDAESAMRAIADVTDWTQDAQQIKATLDLDALRMKMLEAMAW